MKIKLFYFLSLLLIITACENKESKKMSNNLINETSPYLLQHAYNPVDWNPWDSKYLNLAKKENKLIIISVGLLGLGALQLTSMKNNNTTMLMYQTAEQLHLTFLNETTNLKKDLATEFSIWWIKQATQVSIKMWEHGAQSIILYLDSINTFDARIAKAILQPFKKTYTTFRLTK